MLAESSVNKDAMGIMEKKVLFVLAFAMLFVGKRHLYSWRLTPLQR